jgi:hypothetical protein
MIGIAPDWFLLVVCTAWMFISFPSLGSLALDIILLRVVLEWQSSVLYNLTCDF